MPSKRKDVKEVIEESKSEWKIETAIDEVAKTIMEETVTDNTEAEHPLAQSMYVSEVSDHASDIAKKEDSNDEVESSSEEESEEVSEEEESEKGESEAEKSSDDEEEGEEVEVENDSDESTHKYVYIVERRNNDNGLPAIISCTATLLISLWVIRGLILISSFINDKLCCKCF
jgi:hypothetical protein